jgi:glycerophosphoryl diester phosphodiesterase
MKFYSIFIALLWVGANYLMAQPSMNKLPVRLYTDNTNGFVVIGHRGASAYHPENTMLAFRAAYQMGADMIELDITLSKDGIPVVIHDATLKRTTNGTGKVSHYTLAELQKLDAGSWFDEAHKGERIPTLEEVLQFAKGKIAVNIEIKPEAVTDKAEGGIEEKALNLVKTYGMESYVIFSSFHYQALKHLRSLDVDISTALLYEKKQSAKHSPSELVRKYDVQAFNCSFREFSKKWAKDTAEHEIPVFIYTVNKQRRMRKMIKRGASGIFSNRPDVLKQVVDNMWKTK